MEKVADKMSQLVKRNSKEKISITETEAANLPPFKPIPKIQLKRESSLPRIEVDSPKTETPTSGKSVTFPASVSAKLPQNDYSLGQIIPPNAKKLRVRSFLWVKPSTTGLDTSIYYQVWKNRKYRQMHHELAGINTNFILGLYMPIFQSTIGKERGKEISFVCMLAPSLWTLIDK